jgi:hypothetical protein
VERKNGTLVQQNKDVKETARSWQRYSDHLEKKTKMKMEARLSAGPEKLQIMDTRDEARRSIPPSPGSSTIRTPRSLVELGRSSPAPMHPLAHVEVSSEMDIPRIESHLLEDQNASPAMAERDVDYGQPKGEHVDQIAVGLPQLEAPEASEQVTIHDIPMVMEEYLNSDRINSSQTTEDEIATQRLHSSLKTRVHTTYDDIPQIVSERSLKRKRLNPTIFNVFADRIPSDGTPVRPFNVKQEQLSSPPASISAHHLLRKETMDLDILGPNVISTPHRRRRHGHTAHSNLTDILSHERSISEPLIKDEPTGDAHEMLLDEPVVLRTVETHETVIDEARARSEPSDSRPLRLDALQPLDPNIQTTGHVDQETPNKRRKKDQARERAKYQMITESGEGLPPTNEKQPRLAPNIARAQHNRKVQAKNALSPAKPIRESLAAIQIATPPSTTSSRPGSRKLPTKEASPGARPGSRDTPVSASRPAWQLQLKKDSPSDARTKSRRGSPAKVQQQAPLRSKPKSELRTSDFKANPAYNNGYSYAFAETVRKRADRACLPGCTRPECCGSTFRAIAAVAAPLSRREEDKLLEEYLGDAYDTMNLTQMTPDERKELVLQARTRQMSKQVGRHKQAYERHTTPPGFWRIDFPTTQEDMEDRRKVAEQERVLVEERWMEAMRKGGRWMFKDE